jgi:plastocyanin
MADETTTATEEPPAEAAGELDAGSSPPTPPAEATPAALEAGPAEPDPVRDRVLLPLLLPLGAMAAIAVYVLNISRVFLAGGNGAASVVTAILVTVGILVGAAAISATPRLRTSTLTMTLSGLLVLVISAGLVALGPSEHGEESEGAAYEEPAGRPDSQVTVEALAGTAFDAEQYTAAGEIVEVDYTGAPGHTLVFEESVPGFKLALPQGPKSLKAKLKPGDTYTIYCDLPGHRDGGMEAELTVTEAAAAPEGAPTTTPAGTGDPTATTTPTAP